MRHIMTGSLAAILLMAGVCSAGDDPRTIRVTGTGKATAPPDMATVQTGVTTEAGSAEEALTANSKALAKILAALKGFQIAAKDIQTSRFNVHPVYGRDPDGKAPPKVVAYRVTNQVRARVRQLEELGKVLDALVRAGSNQVSGVRLEVAEPAAVLDKARVRAVADARRKAELYAREAGVRVGKVMMISEEPASSPQPRFVRRAALAREAASAVPVATGEEEFRARVQVVFALDDR